MNNTLRRLLRQLLLVSVVLWLPGCLASTKTATLYSLQLIEQAPLTLHSQTLPDMILVMPVRVAPHLQGRSLLYQQANGETHAASTHLWAAALDRQIGQKLTSHLQALLASTNVTLFPGPRYAIPRYQVEIEVQEFSGDGYNFSTLATYTLSDTISKTIRARKNFRQNRPIDNPGYSGYVEAASRAVADLSREVAAALLAVSTPQINSIKMP
ncbi:MAG: PqiC family protein [Desulfobulbus sp.]|nr:PqiC family protein [Desulfobulbus sp.]